MFAWSPRVCTNVCADLTAGQAKKCYKLLTVLNLRLEWCWSAGVAAVLVPLVSATCSRLFSGLTCILAGNQHVNPALK